MGPKLINCCMPEPMGTKDFGKMVKRIQTFEEGKKLKNRGRKEKNYEKGTLEAVEQFSKGRLNGTKRPVELGTRKNNEGKEENCQMNKEML